MPSHRTDYELLDLGDEGAVLLNLADGNYWCLNTTAAQIWKGYLQGKDTEEIVRALAGQYQINLDQMRDDVENALHPGLPNANDFQSKIECIYEPVADGYRLLHSGVAILKVNTSQKVIENVAHLNKDTLAMFLPYLSAKVLSLSGACILHASAVRVGDRTLAFVGFSGAGKTTTARSLALAGATLIGEDKILLDMEDGTISVVQDGEKQVKTWARRWCHELEKAPYAVDFSKFQPGITTSNRIPLHEIIILSTVSRRPNTDELNLFRLERPMAIGNLMLHIFLGSKAPQDWRRHLNLSKRLVDATQVSKAEPPDTIAGLHQATARFYNRIITSYAPASG